MRPNVILAALCAALVLAGCGPSGPSEADMAGCAVRGGGAPISTREVADCVVDRAEIRRIRER